MSKETLTLSLTGAAAAAIIGGMAFELFFGMHGAMNGIHHEATKISHLLGSIQ